MRTEIVGRVADTDVQEYEPIVVPVAARTLDGVEVIEEFAFRPVMPAGAMLRAFESIQPNGVLGNAPVMKFLQKALMPDDREPFMEFMDRDDLMIEAQLIVDVYTAVTEVWSGRPTRPSSASASGGSQTKRTSRAGQRSRASSASKTSRSS